MDEKEYNTYLRQISDSKIGIQLINHAEQCPDCVKLLNLAQISILKHIEKGNLKNEKR